VTDGDDAPPGTRRSVIGASVMLGVAIGVFGLTFGVGAVSAGSSVAQACAMSLLVFTGASQLSAVSVIAAGGSTASALGGAVILAARNGVYGLAMAPIVTGSLPKRLLAAHLVIDETTAMATAQPDDDRRRAAFWATGLALFVCWNVGTLLGALAGTAVDPKTLGLDAAFPAAYLAMVVPHLRHRTGRWAGIAGAAICLALIPFTPVGVPILCASAAILLGVPRPRASQDVPVGEGTRGVP